MITANLSGSSISSKSEDAFSLYEKSCIGEKHGSSVSYMPVEALFLLEHGRLSIFSGSKNLSLESSLQKLKKHDKKLELKLLVYSDLKKKGYLPKTALKYGADFRVYEKGIKPGQQHAPWLVIISKASDKLNWHDFAAKVRIAHSTKKRLLLAIIDEENDVSYYQIDWFKP